MRRVDRGQRRDSVVLLHVQNPTLFTDPNMVRVGIGGGLEGILFGSQPRGRDGCSLTTGQEE